MEKTQGVCFSRWFTWCRENERRDKLEAKKDTILFRVQLYYYCMGKVLVLPRFRSSFSGAGIGKSGEDANQHALLQVHFVTGSHLPSVAFWLFFLLFDNFHLFC